MSEGESVVGQVVEELCVSFGHGVQVGVVGPACSQFGALQGRWRWEGDGADLADLSRLAETLLGQGPDPKLFNDVLVQRPEEEDFEEKEDFDDAIEAWDERWEAVMFAPERTAGAIVICHLGCAQREWLIISGRHRGTIWSGCRVDDVDLAPVLDSDRTPVGFARWYTDWLEKAERTAPTLGRLP
ncbi:SMI1/KNR4 family protein [Streptomyces monashensis]|uniref:SMI1/KNR4 family protein n=1 Tax=Streptomyces monashensis TaxID=1678012 RepID=UPI000AFFCFFD|nr:SMI1/KNR4 family protein [Streptomyces monashensis]